MGTVKIRQVKREIRVLGIAVRPSRDGDRLHMVGVVFRGGLWLDGVMRTTAPGPNVTGSLAEMIVASPHHPQIRVILLHEDLIEGGAYIDPFTLSETTSRPVIAISADHAAPTAREAETATAVHRFEVRRGDAVLRILSVGLRSRDASRVLDVSTRTGTLPEALRVADLVASAVAGCDEQNI